MIYKNSGNKGTYIRKTTKIYNKDGRRIVIENVPVISYYNGGDDMLSADTLDRLHEWRTFLRSIPTDNTNEQRVNFDDYEILRSSVRLQQDLIELKHILMKMSVELEKNLELNLNEHGPTKDDEYDASGFQADIATTSVVSIISKLLRNTISDLVFDASDGPGIIQAISSRFQHDLSYQL